jgi:hypothetical protein
MSWNGGSYEIAFYSTLKMLRRARMAAGLGLKSERLG